MMTRQPPLLDPLSGSHLPSPLFTGRPGWGGQLKNWLAENAYVVTFRLVLGVAMALVVISVVRNRPTYITIEPTPSPTPLHTVDTYAVTARAGEGISDLAARALDEHLAKHPEHNPFSAARHFYAVDSLWRQFANRTLKPGDTLEFPHELLEAAISGAKAHRK